MSNAYGIDLGTRNLKIYNKSTGEVTRIKNAIAIVEKDQMYAYGDDAYSMYEKAPESIEVSFPIVGGVIADFDNMQTMLFTALEELLHAKLKGADIVTTVPTDITEVEKKAFSDMFMKSKIKFRSVTLCEKPLADALGMGLDITEPTGVMIVDIGADTTEISVISLGGLVLSNLLPFGGNQLDDDIVTYLKRNHSLVIGRKTAKQLKEHIGSARMPQQEQTMKVVGRDIVSGLPIEMEISSSMIDEAIKDDLNSLCTSIRLILEKVPPELAKDIVYSGIYLTGGSSKIIDLADLFTEVTNISVKVAENADVSAAYGLHLVLSDEKYRRFGYTPKARIFK